MIKISMIGNLGSDAVVSTHNGKSVINFNAAHTERYKNQQGVETNKTIWVNCSYWSDKTAIAPYLKKGTQVYVEGQPEVKSYTDKQGQHQSQLNIRVSSIQLLGNNKSDRQDAVLQNNTAESNSTFIEDAPF